MILHVHIQFHNVCYLIDIDLIYIIIDLIIRKYTPSASTILIIYLSLVFFPNSDKLGVLHG